MKIYLNRKYIIADILIALFAIAQVFVHLYDVEGDAMNGVRVFPGLVCLLFYFLNGNRFITKVGVSMGLLLSFAMLLSMAYNQNTRPTNILWIWSFIGVAMVLYEFGMRVFWARILFYASSLFFVYLAFRTTASVQDIMYGTSENGISAMCILVLFIYFISIFKSGGRNIPYLPMLVIIVISIWTATRSSIIAMVVLFLFALFNNNIKSEKKNIKSRSGQILALIIVASGIVFFFMNYYDLISAGFERKIERGGFVNEDRTNIWKEYISSVFDSLGNFFLGTSSSDAQYGLFHHFHGNAHNVFIILHSKFGLLGFCFIVFYLLKAMRKARINKMFFLYSLMLVAVIRGMFDWVAFPGPYDPIFYFFILFGFDKYGLLVPKESKETGVFI